MHKVDVLYMDTFPSAPTSHRIWNTQLEQDDWQILIVPMAICLIIFEAQMDILFVHKVKIFMLMKWPYRSLELCRLSNLEWLAYFGHTALSVLKHMSVWRQFFDPHLNAYHSNVGVQIIVVFDLGTSTLPCCVMLSALHRNLALVDGSETADEGRLVMTRSAASKPPTLEFGLVPACWLCPSAIITFWEHSRGDDRVDMHWPSSSTHKNYSFVRRLEWSLSSSSQNSDFDFYYITLLGH